MEILKRKKEIKGLIDEYFNNKVMCEKLSCEGKGLTYKNHVWDHWNSCHEYQEAKLDQLKEDAKRELQFLIKFLRNLHRLVYEEISVKTAKGFGKKYVAKQGVGLYLSLLTRIKILRKVIKDEKQ